MLFRTQNCINNREALSFLLSYAFSLTQFNFLIDGNSFESILIVKSNNSSFIFEPHWRTRSLQRSSRDSAKAILIKNARDNAEEVIVLKIPELDNGHQDHSSSAKLQLVALRVELHRMEIQQYMISSPATSRIPFFHGLCVFRGGICRRHQADPFYRHAAGTRCTEIAQAA